MASLGPISPGTVANSESGGTNWQNPTNAAAEDASFATAPSVSATSSYGSVSGLVDHTVRLFKAGSAAGTSQADTVTEWPTTEAYKTYGGASSLWGTTLTYTDVNNTGFGVGIIAADTRFNDPQTDYLLATNFGFSLPPEATINGIEVGIKRKGDAVSASPGTAYIDHIRMTVHYTISAYRIDIGQATFTLTGQAATLAKGVHYILDAAYTTYSYAYQAIRILLNGSTTTWVKPTKNPLSIGTVSKQSLSVTSSNKASVTITPVAKNSLTTSTTSKNTLNITNDTRI